MPSRQFMVGIGICAPTLLEHGTDEQRRTLPPGVAARRRGLVPAVLRAGRRLRRRQPADARRARRRRVGRQRPEGVDVGRALRRLRAAASPAPTPTCPKHRGITHVHRRHARRPASTSGRCARSTASAHFNEVFLDDVRLPADARRRRGRRRLARRARDARQRAGGDRGRRRLAALSGDGVRERSSASPAPRACTDDPVVRQELVDIYVRERDPGAARAAHPGRAGGRAGAGTRGLGGQARRHHPRQAGGRPRHGDRRRGRPGLGDARRERRRARRRRCCSPRCSASPAAPARSSATSSASGSSACRRSRVPTATSRSASSRSARRTN